jgi:(E)-4-hydroxy-3-methylbut-2-enyl-diphosphate synthase
MSGGDSQGQKSWKLEIVGSDSTPTVKDVIVKDVTVKGTTMNDVTVKRATMKDATMENTTAKDVARFRPTTPPSSDSPLHRRRQSRRIMVGGVAVGDGAPISVQSMTNTRTSDIDATLRQIAELHAAGCDIVRVAVPQQEDANALASIVAKSPLPVIADIHFQSNYVFRAIDAGCAAVRVNPGNIRKFGEVGPRICQAAQAAGVSLRIGINAGSLDQDIYSRFGGATPQALVESALKEARLFEDVGFRDFKISVKHHDPLVTVQTYRLLAGEGDWPLHLGVTEAGPRWQGTVKSCVAFGALLAEGIGDTIRVSLSAPPVEEVKVACKILEYMGLRERKFDLISCPSCGRAQVDVIALANEVAEGMKDIQAPLRVAVMGCIVNGPGEAREADLGVASGNGKGRIFIKGTVVETVPENRIVETLLRRASEMAERLDGDIRPDGGYHDRVVVTRY